MPTLPGRPTSAEHQAAVSRRLELLRAELAGVPGPPAYGAAGGGPVEHLDTGPGDAGHDWAGSGPVQPGSAAEDPWWSSATRVTGARVEAYDEPATPVHHPRPDRGRRPAPDLPHELGHEAVRDLGPAPRVPFPGRHASRRDRPAPGWWPETLKGRLSLGSTQLAVVAVLVAVGLAVTAWSVVRSSPEPLAATPATPVTPVSADLGAGGSGEVAPLVQLPVDPSARGPVGSSSAADPAATDPAAGTAPGTAVVTGTGQAASEVTVDVAGKVRRPGIAVLPVGARVVDAIEAAGGARAGVDLTSLNLARVVLDGEQILVGVRAPAGAAAAALGPGASAPAGSSTSPPGALVNLNSATEADLDTLPDVGPVTARSIITWRAENGGFTGVDELLEVDGIGEATLSRLAPLVTV